jgi:molybdopterin/thiamine biosynthesis adenylyltransferase
MAELKAKDAHPDDLGERRVLLVGCGTIMSRVARNLAHWGIKKIVLCDFDTVEPKNVLGVSAQIYSHEQVGMPKVEALAEILRGINPAIDVEVWNRRYEGLDEVADFVFAGLDEFEGRVSVRDSCLRDGSGVQLLIEGRLGEDQGRVFALEPENLLHQERYCEPENWEPFSKPDPAEGTCGGTITNVMLAELCAINMTMRFWSYLIDERGAEAVVPNDETFQVEPIVAASALIWN